MNIKNIFVCALKNTNKMSKILGKKLLPRATINTIVIDNPISLTTEKVPKKKVKNKIITDATEMEKKTKKKVLLQKYVDVFEIDNDVIDIIDDINIQTNEVSNNVIQNKDIKNNKEKMLSNEMIPCLSDDMWTKKSKNIDIYNGNLDDEYFIDKTIFLLDDEDLENFEQSKNGEYDIYKIYKIFDDDKCIYEYTKNTIYNKLCRNEILEKQKNDKQCKFDLFKNTENVKIKILSILRTKNGEKVKKEVDGEKENCIKKDSFGLNNMTITKNIVKKHTHLQFEEYEKYISSLLINEILVEQMYYVVKVFFDNTSKCYIYGSYIKPIKKQDVIDQLYNNCINEKYIKHEIIKEINIQIETQGLLYLDEEIIINDSIKNGLNTYFNIFDMCGKYTNEKIFIHVQNILLILKYANVDIGSCGYVVTMNIGDYKYIYGDIDKNIVAHISKCYSKIDPEIECKNKNKDKFTELLMTTDVKNIEIKLEKRNVNVGQLEKMVYFFKFATQNKEKLLNYYEKTTELQNEIKTNVKTLEGKIFAMSKFKKH